MSPDILELERLNAGYVASVEHGDTAWFRENLAGEFFNTNPDGSIVDRDGFLKQVAAGASVSKVSAVDVKVRVSGPLAIIHARTTYVRSDGTPGTGRYTDVWERQAGRWKCVAAHVTRCA